MERAGSETAEPRAWGRSGDHRTVPAAPALPWGALVISMMVGMTLKAKIAISIPAELLEAVRAEVAAGRAANVSAYVADALAEKAKLDALDDLLDEMLEESGGPLTSMERAEIDEKAGWA